MTTEPPSAKPSIRAAADIGVVTSLGRRIGRDWMGSLVLKPKFPKACPPRLGQRLLKSRRKTAGPGHVLVAASCVAPQAQDLSDVIPAYFANYSNTKAALR